MTDVLIISNGNAEDLIGATLCTHLEGLSLAALPLVGAGKHYEGRVERILGPRTQMPSGGFPFNSLENLIADLKAGFHLEIIRQIRSAQLARREVRAVAVVGDAYALAIGVLASDWGRLPLFHLQPLISNHYRDNRSVWMRLTQPNQYLAEDFMFYERWMHRFVQAVYVRDKSSENRAKFLGMRKARFVGNMGLDTLSGPERNLKDILDGRPVVALLPGSREDYRFSLPIMLEAVRMTPEIQGIVSWAPSFTEIPKVTDWSISIFDANTAVAQKNSTKVRILRAGFSAVLHASRIVVGTAGFANEQASAMGLPVVAFPTPGPQYIRAFAVRQKRLLGKSLHLVEPSPEAVAEAVRVFLTDETAREAARREGLERNGPRGALPQIAREIRQALALRGAHAG